MDLQPLLAAAHKPLHQVAIRLLADQGTVLNAMELTTRNEPKHCGAQFGWAGRPGMFPMKPTSWCNKLLASARSAQGTHGTVQISFGAVLVLPLFNFDRLLASQVKLDLLADQRTASDDVELIVPKEPKHCGARSTRPARYVSVETDQPV